MDNQSASNQSFPAPVPALTVAEEADRRANLQRQLKENDSQRTEVTGHINQLSIQLHRWNLRLQNLNDRRKELNLQLSQLPRQDAAQS